MAAEMFAKLRIEDYALLRILYNHAEWWYLGFTVSQLADMTGMSRSKVEYRLRRVLLERGLVAKRPGCPALWHGVKDADLRERIVDAWRKTYRLLLNVEVE